MYLSNTEPLTSLGCPLNAIFHVPCGPVPQDAGTPLLLLLQIFKTHKKEQIKQNKTILARSRQLSPY
jgi:hypothetical protein